jgi:hypothetical protein
VAERELRTVDEAEVFEAEAVCDLPCSHASSLGSAARRLR